MTHRQTQREFDPRIGRLGFGPRRELTGVWNPDSDSIRLQQSINYSESSCISRLLKFRFAETERSIGFASGAGCRGLMRVSVNAHEAWRVCGKPPPGSLHAEPQRSQLQRLKYRIPMSRESAEPRAMGCTPMSAGRSNCRQSAGFRGYQFMAFMNTPFNKRTASSLSRQTKVKHH